MTCFVSAGKTSLDGLLDVRLPVHVQENQSWTKWTFRDGWILLRESSLKRLQQQHKISGKERVKVRVLKPVAPSKSTTRKSATKCRRWARWSVVTSWMGDPYVRATPCVRPEISPGSNSVQTLQNVLWMRLEIEVPQCVYACKTITQRVLKILWSKSEFGGFWKHWNIAACTNMSEPSGLPSWCSKPRTEVGHYTDKEEVVLIKEYAGVPWGCSCNAMRRKGTLYCWLKGGCYIVDWREVLILYWWLTGVVILYLLTEMGRYTVDWNGTLYCWLKRDVIFLTKRGRYIVDWNGTLYFWLKGDVILLIEMGRYIIG